MAAPLPAVMARWRNLVDPRVMHTYFEHSWVDDEALAWARRGVSASDVYLWHDLGLPPEEVARLLAAGLSFERVVRAWWQAGIPIDDVADWLAAGFSAAEAAEQREKGVTAEEAAALRALRRDESEPEPEARAVRGAATTRQGPPPRTRPGPPPSDEEAACAQIAAAFAGALTDDMDSAVEAGGRGGACLDHARRLLAQPEALVPTVNVDRVEFVNDHEARVFLDVEAAVRAGPRPSAWIGPGPVGSAQKVRRRGRQRTPGT